MMNREGAQVHGGSQTFDGDCGGTWFRGKELSLAPKFLRQKQRVPVLGEAWRVGLATFLSHRMNIGRMLKVIISILWLVLIVLWALRWTPCGIRIQRFHSHFARLTSLLCLILLCLLTEIDSVQWFLLRFSAPLLAWNLAHHHHILMLKLAVCIGDRFQTFFLQSLKYFAG